ncbi:MAG: hypothetical protein MI919_00950, partial [Holophagales bacterium]|nr:hypothetical protein [Holophagales bacterium]
MYQLDLAKFSRPAEQTEPGGEGGRTAILVIHGIGQQNPLETLDQFARGLRTALDRRYFPDGNGAYSVIHRQVDYLTPDAQEPWLENYISL